MTLVGNTAIVTGGGSGIGLGIAECLARAGAQILLVDRDADLAQRSAHDLSEIGPRAVGIGGDVRPGSVSSALLVARVGWALV
jgi:NAD(P)-dependent dehydrogenase (short-subunit alcohol dehydrogenase family)